MEPDLSLIEIAGEDDLLLQQSPAHEVASVKTSNYFPCSPLQIFRSQWSTQDAGIPPTNDLNCERGEDKHCSLSTGDGPNKENSNENRFGIPKLSIERQKMKRKRGGFNLRKSLAWNRAFFTEEGVLNPLELSVVSGNFDKFSAEVLPVINEEGTNSVSGVMDCSNDSTELLALEEKLFKELPLGTSNGGKSIGSSTQPKQDSCTCDNETPAPAVMRKVLPIHDSRRCGSKRGGFSRPLPSASQKRQAIANTKVVPRNAKLPQTPASKPDPCLITTEKKSTSLSISRLKHNRIAQPGVTATKSVGLKCSSSKFKGAHNNAKPGPDCTSGRVKSSVLHARRNVVSTHRANSPLEINSPANFQPQQVTKFSNSLEAIPDIELPAVPGKKEHPSISGYGGSNGTIPQRAQHIGRNLQCAQPQTAKPSGLRMPSPSLGLFSQPKASAPLSQKNQTCNLPKSYAPSLQKLHPSNSIRAPMPLHESGKIPRVVSNTQTDKISALISSARCSIPSTAKTVLPENTKLDFDIYNLDQSGMKLLCAPKSSVVVKKSIPDSVDQKCHDRAEPHNIEIPGKEDSELQIIDQKLLLQSAPCQTENSYVSSQQNPALQVNAVCGTDDITEHRGVISVTYQHNNSESEFIDIVNCSKLRVSVVDDDKLLNMSDAREQSGKQEGRINCCIHEPDPISLVANKEPRAKDEIGILQKGSFEESKNYAKGRIADIKVQDCGTRTLESCQHSSQCTKKSDRDTTGDDEMISNSPERDTLMPYLNRNLFLESCKKNLSTCSRYLTIADDLHEQSGEKEPQHPVIKLFHAGDVPSVSVEVKPPSETYKRFIDGLLRHEVKFNGEVTSMDSDLPSVSKDQAPCEVPTSSSFTNFHLESRDSRGSELGNPHSTSLFIPYMPSKSVCETEKMCEGQNMEISEHKSSIKNQVVITKALCGDNIDGSDERASVLQNNILSSMHVFNEPDKERSYLIRCGSPEVYQISNNENQKLQTHDGTSSKSSQKYDGSVPDVDPKVCGHNGSKLESADGTSRLKDVQREKGDSRSDTAKKLHEDAGGCSTGSDLLVERCISNHSCSEAQNLFTARSDLINEQCSELVKLQIPCHAVKQSSQHEERLCLNSASSNESQEENASERSDYVLPEQSQPQEGVPEISSTAFKLPHGIDSKEKSKHINRKDAFPDSEFSFECYEDSKLRHGTELNSQATSLELDYSPKVDEEMPAAAATGCSFLAFRSSDESGLSRQHVRSPSLGSIQHSVELNGLESKEAADKNIYQDSNSASSKLKHQFDGAICSAEKDEFMSLGKSKNDMKRDAPGIKPPLGAVPFSDEWLAAIEAAGEEILTSKSGAVQNSPPDKSLPEPGPWSPVRKKVSHDIGPFDCTKKVVSVPPANADPK